jgi:hypothetical protein
MSSPSLKRARIRYSDKKSGRVQCRECGAEWTDWVHIVTPIRPARRSKGWWKCPMGCNTEAMEDFPPPGEIEGGS